MISNNRRILFINQDSGYLTTDIINAFVNAGNTCVLLTGKLKPRNKPLHETVWVEKITPYKRNSMFLRTFTWTAAFFQILVKVIIKYRNYELFIVSNPPFAVFLPLFVKNPFSLLIFDIYPDALYEMKYLKQNSGIVRFWQKANRSVFKKALKIYTITNSMKDMLMNYSDNSKIQIVPLWSDNDFFKPVNINDNYFIKKHNLNDSFVVMYSGNIGLSCEIDVIPDVASIITDPKIVFLIIGDGAKKEMLEKKVRDLKLRNLIMLPWQPTDDLPFVLSAASLSVISQGKNVSKISVPSKLYNFLSVGAPLLCITSPDSETGKLVNKYNCGKCFDPENVKGIADYITELANNEKLCRQMKINSLKASRDFSSINANSFF